MPTCGDEVSYRALGTGALYPAVVTVVRLDGTLDVEIQLPGVKEPFGRGRVKWFDTKTNERGVCMPKEP